MASFMEKIRRGGATFDTDSIVLTAGATAANELLTFILAYPGDALLVPTPYYPGFDRDLRWRTRVNKVPIHCHSSNSFQLTLRSLKANYASAEASNLKVRGLLITNPSNPLGMVASCRLLDDVIDFIAKKNIHLISDEIYSGFIFSPREFVRIAEIVAARGHHSCKGIHFVYSLSKDLGLPGFRVGADWFLNDLGMHWINLGIQIVLKLDSNLKLHLWSCIDYYKLFWITWDCNYLQMESQTV